MPETPEQHQQEPSIKKSPVIHSINTPRKKFGWKTYLLLTAVALYGARWGRNEIIEHKQAASQAIADERLRIHYALAKVTHILIEDQILVNSLNGKVSPLDDKDMHWFNVGVPESGGYTVTSTTEGSESFTFKTPEETADYLRSEYAKTKAFVDFLVEMQNNYSKSSTYSSYPSFARSSFGTNRIAEEFIQ